ncbi:twin-arginine translocation pathway signal [Rhodoferax sp. BAB1]|uniref:twin-arginine translocation pathway signal n=1 Tax=Rhodoferax sp. BAB1 TaxID=2741720 RepID=UPI00157700E8|nr:twin-arginine translocation pathway signal [Rhodoferax sp. BAB1]QKO23024.1 twin-arginine translocation pathway signal [Rhodoferax sp. BAB1]
MLIRRHLLGLLASLALLAGCATAPPPTLREAPPIVFVHGNGDSAALWLTTLWRFESNGWPRERLHAIELPYPLARDDDSKAQAGRSSTAEHMAFLKTEVEKVLRATGASQVVLFGNSRGGNAIRNYIQNGGGAATVSHAILGGTPNHGVWAIKGFREGNEFSGTGPFLTGLNAPKNANGDEVTGPVRWLTIRSDNNDKFAQPDGLWIGAKGKPTNVTYAGPELKGASNVVIPRIDHRETSFSPAAFAAAYRFLTGRAPAADITPEPRIELGGTITGQGVDPLNPATGNFANNLPQPSAELTIYATDASTGQRLGAAAYTRKVGADGRWGPFTAQAGMAYEFEIKAPGYATTHIYRSAFARSSAIVNLRPERIAAADQDAQALAIFTRPRGYFDAQRDRLSFDGQALPPGVPPAGAGVSSSKLKLPSAADRSIAAEFNGEKLGGRVWPATQQRVTVLELTY